MFVAVVRGSPGCCLVRCSLLIVGLASSCSLCVVCCLLFVVSCSLFVVRCVFVVGWWLLVAGWRLLFVVRC